MTRTGRTSRLAAALLATLLFVAACGTDGGSQDHASPAEKASTHSTTTVDDAVTPTTTEDAKAEDMSDMDMSDSDMSDMDHGDPDQATAQHVVESVNLTVDDLPAGWTAKPDDGADHNVFDQCAGDALDLDQHTVAKARSMELTKDLEGNAQLMVQTATGYLDDVDPASEMVEILGDQEFVDCSTKGVVDSNDNPDLAITGGFQTAEGLPQLGDGLAALQGDFTIADKPSGLSAHLGALMIVVRTGPLVTAVTATAVDTPGDEQLLYGLLDTIAQRQAAALETT